jgi:hypothetical protein
VKNHHVSLGGVSRRYTIRFMTEPTREVVEIRAVTPAGELMAAVMAFARLLRENPDVRISGVEVARVEDYYTIDPAKDVLDYWTGSRAEPKVHSRTLAQAGVTSNEPRRTPDNPHVTLVIVHRLPTGWRDRLRRYEVLIDDRVVGRLRPGEFGRYEVAPGHHVLAVAIDWKRSRSFDVSGVGDGTKSFRCGPRGSALWALVDLFKRADDTWLFLEPDTN